MGKKNLENEHTFRVFSVRALEKWVSSWKGIWQSGGTIGTSNYQTEGHSADLPECASLTNHFVSRDLGIFNRKMGILKPTYNSDFIYFVFIFFKILFIFLRERESMRARWGGGRQRAREMWTPH